MMLLTPRSQMLAMSHFLSNCNSLIADAFVQGGIMLKHSWEINVNINRRETYILLQKLAKTDFRTRNDRRSEKRASVWHSIYFNSNHLISVWTNALQTNALL